MIKAVGIDIGGTNIKAGIVDFEGRIIDFSTIATSTWLETKDFISQLMQLMRQYHSGDILGYGIAIPGLLSWDRHTPLDVTAIPDLDNTTLYDLLVSEFPGKKICLENDSNAATLAEFLFSPEKSNHSFLLVTMGTGIGSGLIFQDRIFIGANGNALELGETISGNGEKLEHRIGIEGIKRLANARLLNFTGNSLLKKFPEITVKDIITCACSGDVLAQTILHEAGEILGEALVNFIRLFDITNIAIGGGICDGFPFIKPGIEKVFQERLTKYYLGKIQLHKARYGNNAGIMGAASLCFKDYI
mgnify:CR=1 FL=1